MSRIKQLTAIEILDSRGRPTIAATCELISGARAGASVPAGASTGAAEAHELRDGDPSRYNGLGCRRAVENIRTEINQALRERDFSSQHELDNSLIQLDGTPQKRRLGANAILAVSIAFARAQSRERRIPLYLHFAQMLGEPIRHLPRLTINLFSGGKHAGGQVAIQDVLIVPAAATTIDESLVTASAVYHSAVDLVDRKYGMRWLTAAEGGLAPPAENVDALLTDAVQAIEMAGLTPGKDVFLAVDIASSHFYSNGAYHIDRQSLTSRQMIDRVVAWIRKYPIASVEDALAEEDWNNWPLLNETISDRALTLGDDLLCTNPDRIRRAIANEACNALLLKVNQIGTLSEALDAIRLVREVNWNVTISVRSGDTEDNWFSDLVVGWSGDQSKAGSITQSERLAKYNRLLTIEAETNLPLVSWPR
jgi:enolase